MAIDQNVDTEGHFEFRIKPKIEHMPSHLNRAVEELQQIILLNKESSKVFMEKFAEQEAKIAQLEANIEALQDKAKESE
jgi:isochorismate hydrolase